MPPIAAEEALYHDLLSIYARAGAEVTYETDSGDVRPYWPKRFLQAVKRANKKGELFEFAHRLIRQDDVSRGFLVSRRPGGSISLSRPSWSTKTKPYHGAFDFDVVQIARQRVADHGYDVLAPKAPVTPVASSTEARADTGSSTSAEVTVSPGTSFDVRVTVGDDGKLALSLI
jgi:hypothetical protein